MKKLLTTLLFLVLGAFGFAEKFEKPIMLTSIGQSADVQMIKVLLKKADLEADFDKLVTEKTLGDHKTLILAIGGSSKGLGAAGIKVEDELDRSEKLIKAAREKGVKIVGMHVGGQARRGELSDKFVNVSISGCDYLIVVEDGNKDGLFTKVAEEKKIPLVLVPKISEAVKPLKDIF
ncbi:DUF6305 family protein [Cetobacterium sp.]|uniref:DUF6305 family protein n=1 Tax=Cetobacterium sp. TaxID=2071632 RepID=UPI002FC584E4